MASPFFTDEAMSKIVGAVQAVEAKSSAEIVVSVHSRSDDYREVELMAGLFLAVVTLALLIYHPAELDEDLMPIETLAAFVIGSVLVNKIAPLKRLLGSKKRHRERTLTAARAHFVEAGVSCTRDRSGILVFISELERAVCVVPDVGINPEKLGEGWKERIAALESAVAALDAPAFAAALQELGPLLGEKYPRREDDVNELPDAPIMQMVKK